VTGVLRSVGPMVDGPGSSAKTYAPSMPLPVQAWFEDPVLQRWALAGGVLLFVWIAVRLSQRAATRYLQEADARYRARKLLGFVGWLTGFLILANVFSDRFAQLTVAFGVAGAGIAFALQEVIASVAGWVAISFGGFYRIGDRVQLGGIKGDVIDIGVLRTTLMEVGQWVDGDLYNGRIVRIANSFVFKEPVFNYSGDFPFLWDELTLGVKYGSDYAAAREILARVGREVVGDFAEGARSTWRRVAEKYRIEEAQVEPMVTAVATDNWMAFTLRYVVDYRARRRTKDALFRRIIEEIDASAGRVAVASAGVEVVGVPPIEVRFRRPGAGAGAVP